MALDSMMSLFGKYDLFINTEECFSFDEVKARVSVAPQYETFLKRWLVTLTENNILQESKGKFALAHEKSGSNQMQIWRDFYSIESKVNYGLGFVKYLEKCSQCLSELLIGQVEPLELLFPKGDTSIAVDTYQNTLSSQVLNKVAKKTIKAVSENLNRGGEPLRILEIGAGVGGTSDGVISELSGENMVYYYTDVSTFFLNNAKERYKGKDWIEYKVFDINDGYKPKDEDPAEYDVIMAANVLHNAKDGPKIIKMLRDMLKPGGALVILDAVREPHYLMTSIGFNDGLHGFEDFRATTGKTFFEREQWYDMFEGAGGKILLSKPELDDSFIGTGQGIFVVTFPTGKMKLQASEIHSHIKSNFGDIPVQSDIEIVSKIPAWDSNETDRSLNRESYCAPEGELETKIAGIWGKVLNESSIGRHDNFFMIGGDSLLVSQVIAEMKSEIPSAQSWEWGDLMREILATPTVYEIASKLNNTLEKKDVNMVKLMGDMNRVSTSNHPTQVVFHAGTGTLTPYMSMVRVLAENGLDEKTVGFACDNVKAYLDIPYKELYKALGEKYAAALLETKDRHFILFGHCVGGLIALEAAKVLKHSGAIVEEVILVSSNINQSNDVIDPKENSVFSSDIVLEKVFGRLIGADIVQAGYTIGDETLSRAIKHIASRELGTFEDDMLMTLENTEFDSVAKSYKCLLDKTHEQRLAKLSQVVTANVYSVEQGKASMLTEMYKVFKHSFRATCSYQPDVYEGKTRVFKCSDHTDNFFLHTFGVFSEGEEAWSKYLKNMSFGSVSGDHMSCMDTPNIESNIDLMFQEV